jgi:hypothetical protein
VFGLAIAAAAGALGLIAATYTSLKTATEQQRVADPPDLRIIIEKAEEGGHALSDKLSGR